MIKLTKNEQHKNNLLEQKYVLPKHFDISNRMVTYWKQNAILPFFKKGKHARMNIPQAVWLCLIHELSQVGVPTQQLAQLAQTIWQAPIEEGHFDKKLDWAINEEKRKGNATDAKRLEGLHQIKADPRLKLTLAQEHNPMVDAIIDNIMTNRKPLSFYYFPKSNKFEIKEPLQPLTEHIIALVNTQTYLCVPLLPFIKAIVEVEFKLLDKDFSYLSDIENQIKALIKHRAPKFIDVVVNNEHLKPLVIREQHKSAEAFSNFILNNKFPKKGKIVVEKRAQGNYKLTIITK